jgi:hypothetical protein
MLCFRGDGHNLVSAPAARLNMILILNAVF